MKIETLFNILVLLLIILLFYLLGTKVLRHSATDRQVFIALVGIMIGGFFTLITLYYDIDRRVTRLEVHMRYMKKDIHTIKTDIHTIQTRLLNIEKKLG